MEISVKCYLNRRTVCAAVFTIIMGIFVALSARGDNSSDLNNINQSISDVQNNIGMQESVQKDMEKELKRLESYKDDLVKYMNEMNKSHDALQKDILALDEKIRGKEDEIKKIDESLKKAEYDVDDRYNSMKLRIRYLYESGDLDYVEAFLSADNVDELVNKIEYISKIIEYDRNMLDEYKQSLAEIEVIREELKKEHAQLSALRQEQQIKSDEIVKLINKAAKNINAKEEQISDAEKIALEKEKEIRELYKYLDYLEEEESRIIAQSIAESISESIRQSEEESSRLAAGLEPVTTTEYKTPDYAIREGDLERLAAVIYCEAGAEPYEGKMAVGTVIMNRVANKLFPNTIEGVITQPYQFSPVSVSGRYYLVLAKPLDETCLKAAREILYDGVRTGRWHFFRTVKLAQQTGKVGDIIGGHVFY